MCGRIVVDWRLDTKTIEFIEYILKAKVEVDFCLRLFVFFFCLVFNFSIIAPKSAPIQVRKCDGLKMWCDVGDLLSSRAQCCMQNSCTTTKLWWWQPCRSGSITPLRHLRMRSCLVLDGKPLYQPNCRLSGRPMVWSSHSESKAKLNAASYMAIIAILWNWPSRSLRLIDK